MITIYGSMMMMMMRADIDCRVMATFIYTQLFRYIFDGSRTLADAADYAIWRIETPISLST